jgi:uncharacterized membrane protein YqjE
MNETRYTENHVRSLSAIVAEIKEEVKDFVQTRVEMFKSEVRETLNAWKTAVPLALIAVLLLATAYLLITLAVVGLVAVAFWDNPYRWFLAFLIVGVVWSLGGGLLGWLALREFQSKGLFPKKTMEVLKADKIWIQSEAGDPV